ncbi:GYP8 [Candida pseudojiufengensis]|uniref:GYP8 n=1 Tax=Candida pseudojiufengensis TaxID=497109 RepID=UPI002224042C|nr:GYP8 [Candida pseudojiufengensis]KAI5958506.1 GYP8 [Candida pseudojiufengensis]
MTTIEQPTSEISNPIRISRSPSSSISISVSNNLPLSTSNLNGDNWVNMELGSSSLIYTNPNQKISSPVVPKIEIESSRNSNLNLIKESLNSLNENVTIKDKRSNLNKLSNLIQEVSKDDQYFGIISNELRSKIWSEFLNLSNTTDPTLIEESQTISSTIKSKDSSKINTTNNSVLSTPTTLNNGRFSPQIFLENLNSVDLPPHKDEEQVKLDIQRSFTILSHIQQQTISSSSSSSKHDTPCSNLPNHSDDDDDGENDHFSETMEKGSSFATIFSSSDINNLKKILLNLIIKVLRKYPSLDYYQGYHDIASIVLLICYSNENKISSSHHQESTTSITTSSIENNIDQELAFRILEKLTIYHLRDFMISDINLSVNHLKLIPTILELCDDQIFELIKQTSQSYNINQKEKFYDYKFYQGLSSILTLYSHDLSNLNHILIIWDFILSNNSVLISSYIYASSLIILKPKIWEFLQLEKDQMEFSGIDHDLVHTVLSPSNLFDGLSDQDLSKILSKSIDLLTDFPANNTLNYKKWFETYNDHSVLNNTSNPNLNIIDIETKYGDLLKDNHDLIDLVQTQNDEINRQTIEEIQEQQKLLLEEEEFQNSKISSTYETDQDEEEEEEEESENNSQLNSMSSSLTLNTSSSIHKIKSSSFFQKLFKSSPTSDYDEDEDEIIEINEKNTIKEDNKKINTKQWILPNSIYSIISINNIYKFGIAIGIIGVFLHIIIINKHNLIQIYKDNLITNGGGPHIVNNLPRQIINIGKNLFNKTFQQSNNIFQIGSGTLRNSIYGFEI